MGDAAFKSRFGTVDSDDSVQQAKLAVAAAPYWKQREAAGLGGRKQSADNEVLVPIRKAVHLQVTSSDVIHSWTVPSFGLSLTAAPGQVEEVVFEPTRLGLYAGDCTVQCGKHHADMPVVIRVVPDDVYVDWIRALKTRDRKKAQAIAQAEAARQAGQSPPK